MKETLLRDPSRRPGATLASLERNLASNT